MPSARGSGSSARGPKGLRTDRLLLRRWRDSDLEPFAKINADPAVMEYFPATLSRGESDEMVSRIEQTFERSHLGLWAVEVIGNGSFAGFVGLWPTTFEAHFTPAIEIGWRLDRTYWGQGYATEAARAVTDDGFERLHLGEIVSFTAAINIRSRRVMEKLGMSHSSDDDFDHPRVGSGDPLRRHMLYRLPRPQRRFA